ncbi:MAG TPA: DUF2505 family protein [Limnobacter sp.]|nr:DUF2505 family protein [Limnobacter sp.]
MAHEFTTTYSMAGVSKGSLQRCISDPEFHERLCRSLPGDNLSITESTGSPGACIMKREVDLDVQLPEVVKKLLSGALRLKRADHWELHTLHCHSVYTMNLPASFELNQGFKEYSGGISITNHWRVEVKIPLIGTSVARQIEPEIRRFHGVELDMMSKMISGGEDL